MSSFGIDAYPTNSVPVGAEMPYIVYTLTTGSLYNGEQNITANLWCRTSSESEINAVVSDIENTITSGGMVVACDGGAVWVKRGNPWCQSVNTEDTSLKCRYINFDVEYLTEN